MNSKRIKIDAANEDWHEIPTIGSTRRVTQADPTPKVVEVDYSLSAQDLTSLKKRDPFLYYSIPGVRDATIRKMGHAVDIHQVAQNGLKRYCHSCPASISTSSCTSEHVAKVKRCTSVSFECPADLLIDLDELSDDLADMDMEKSLADDPFESLFELLESS